MFRSSYDHLQKAQHHDEETTVGRAIAQAVIWSSGICGGQSGAGAGFLRVLRFPLPTFIPPNSPSS
jgi:hypothetical protein